MQDGRAIQYATNTRHETSHRSTDISHCAGEADNFAHKEAHELTDVGIPIDGSDMPYRDGKGRV